MSATNARHRMLDEMMRAWVAELSDDALLEAWQRLINARRRELSNAITRTTEEIVDELRRCEYGDALHLVRPITFATGGPRHVVYFSSYQPRAKRLWVTAARREKRGHAHYINESALGNYQPSRTDLKTRQRAAATTKENAT